MLVFVVLGAIGFALTELIIYINIPYSNLHIHERIARLNFASILKKCYKRFTLIQHAQISVNNEF